MSSYLIILLYFMLVYVQKTFFLTAADVRVILLLQPKFKQLYASIQC